MLIVQTKEELKKAQKDKVEEFMIVGELAEKVKKAKGISKLSKGKVVALSSVIAAGIATAIPTGGSSSAIAFAAAGGATSGGLSTGVIIAIISVGGALAAYALYKDYDVSFETTPSGGLKVVCSKK